MSWGDIDYLRPYLVVMTSVDQFDGTRVLLRVMTGCVSGWRPVHVLLWLSVDIMAGRACMLVSATRGFSSGGWSGRVRLVL